MTYWTNFARTGDPNGPDLPQWPRYTGGRRSAGHAPRRDQRGAPDVLRTRYETLDSVLTRRGREVGSSWVGVD